MGLFLKAEGIKIQLGDRVLFESLDLAFEPGEFVAISGPSGSGKTTLLHCLAGFNEPNAGKVDWLLNGKAFHPQLESHRIGFIYQHLRLAKTQNALATVCCGRLSRYSFLETAFGFSKKDQQEAYETLCGLGLKANTYKPLAILSGGERQRVAIGRALHQEPVIYFADEPVANLDRANAHVVLSRLRHECHEHKRTVVAVLHDNTQIGLFADKILKWDAKVPGFWKVEAIR